MGGLFKISFFSSKDEKEEGPHGSACTGCPLVGAPDTEHRLCPTSITAQFVSVCEDLCATGKQIDPENPQHRAFLCDDDVLGKENGGLVLAALTLFKQVGSSDFNHRSTAHQDALKRALVQVGAVSPQPLLALRR